MARRGTTNTLTLTVPIELADAVRAEALRQMRRPGEVVADALRSVFPEYVEVRLRRALQHPITGRVIDAYPRGTPEQPG